MALAQAALSAEKHQEEDGFGSLFDAISDEDAEDDAGPALVEEEYVRTCHAGAVPPMLKLALISLRHSLWGHRLWNAALLLAEMADGDEIDIKGKSVLELGAGAGLPSLICALKGASKVVISDYATSTDNSLMVPIQINIDRVQPEFVPEGTLHAVGHVWGRAVDDLLAPLAPLIDGVGSDDDGTGREGPAAMNVAAASAVVAGNAVCASLEEAEEGQREITEGRPQAVGHDASVAKGRGEGGRGKQMGFDVVIMADLLFNRSQHEQLLDTCDRCLRRGLGAGTMWVSFSHHDPEKAELDMKFFALASEKGFVAERIKAVQMRDLFVENDGMDDLRGEVHLWCLKRRKNPPE